MKTEEVVKLSNDFQKEAKAFGEKYKDFDFENSTDLNEKIDFLYNYICVVNIELNSVAAMMDVALEKIFEAM